MYLRYASLTVSRPVNAINARLHHIACCPLSVILSSLSSNLSDLSNPAKVNLDPLCSVHMSWAPGSNITTAFLEIQSR